MELPEKAEESECTGPLVLPRPSHAGITEIGTRRDGPTAINSLVTSFRMSFQLWPRGLEALRRKSQSARWA